MLTVRDIIEQLSALDPEMPFLVDYEGSPWPATGLEQIIAVPRGAGWLSREWFDTLDEFLAAEWVDDEDKVGAFIGVAVAR
jgi:hypothetical protein